MLGVDLTKFFDVGFGMPAINTVEFGMLALGAIGLGVLG
jgi:hypothetical protein